MATSPGAEIAIVDEVIDALLPLDAGDVSNWSHAFLGWKAARAESEATGRPVVDPLQHCLSLKRAAGRVPRVARTRFSYEIWMGHMARETQFPRRIIKTVEWIRHASDIDPDGRFLAENLEGFLFIVARTPQEFPRVRIADAELYYARIDLEPPVRVWFTFDDRFSNFAGYRVGLSECKRGAFDAGQIGRLSRLRPRRLRSSNRLMTKP